MTAASQIGPPYLRLAELCRADQDDGVITRWFDGHAEARAKFRVRIAYLAMTRRVDWDEEHFRSVKNVPGVFEIKWKAEGKQFRLAGYDHREGYFVMVLGYTHKGDTYSPPGWLASIKRNKRDAENGNYQIVEFEP